MMQELVEEHLDEATSCRGKPPKRYGLVRLGDIIPEVMADLQARCKERQAQLC